MRISFVFAFATLMTLTDAWAQQAPAHKSGRAELISQLRSDDVQVRSEAFESVRSDPTALRDPKVRVALVDLLDRENHEASESVKDQGHPEYIGSGEDEAGSEYVSTLAETVAKVVDWSSPRQVCILAESVFPPDELADHGNVAIPCLLHRYKNAPPPVRGYLVAMLIQTLAKGRAELDAATIAEIREIILGGLRDSDHGIKGETIRALGKFGGADMIPALKASADADTSNDAGSQSIRRRTLQAIAEIEKRAGKN